jgi:hypothetical protein
MLYDTMLMRCCLRDTSVEYDARSETEWLKLIVYVPAYTMQCIDTHVSLCTCF